MIKMFTTVLKPKLNFNQKHQYLLFFVATKMYVHNSPPNWNLEWLE